MDEHTSQGKRDSFLSKFNTNGVFHWALTWGGEDDDEAHGIALDEFGNVYVTGYFRETVDLDPGPGIDNHICDGFANSFLLKFDVFGNFQWARSWGGLGVEMGDAVAVDSNGFVLVEGIFEDIVDFDPGQATAERESNGSRDICVSKFNPDGDFEGRLDFPAFCPLYLNCGFAPNPSSSR